MLNTVEVRNIKLGEGIPKICVPLVGKTNEEIRYSDEFYGSKRKFYKIKNNKLEELYYQFHSNLLLNLFLSF